MMELANPPGGEPYGPVWMAVDVNLGLGVPRGVLVGGALTVAARASGVRGGGVAVAGARPAGVGVGARVASVVSVGLRVLVGGGVSVGDGVRLGRGVAVSVGTLLSVTVVEKGAVRPCASRYSA